MDILNTISLESNSQINYDAINFDGGNLSSDTGLLLSKEFLYQAGSWVHPRRVVFKIEKPYGQVVHLYTFIVTTLEMKPYQMISFYCKRGKTENFIKKGKCGFDFAFVSSSSKLVNAN